MTMITNLKQLMTLMVFLAFFSGMAQNNYWHKTSEREVAKQEKVKRNSSPKDFQLYHLNLEAFKQHLQQAPLRSEVHGKSDFIVSFPRPSGKMESFRVTESPIMAPGLAEKYPMIKTYSATGMDDPTATMRFSVTQFGVHTMALSGKIGETMIDPYTKDRKNYIVYKTASLPADKSQFKCSTVEGGIPDEKTARNIEEFSVNADESKLRTYRLALSCNADYGNVFATNPGTEVEDIQAQMTIAINRVNEIYERDLAITLQFVENNDELIYYGNSADDPWMGEYNDRTQEVIDSTIGDANYDIGHNFNLTGGGNAGCIGCVCVSGQKGSGETGQQDPTGDAFYIDYVAHEMGHQFGAYHTMNTCSRSGNGETEVEPDSGSSIMGYAGICPVNVQQHSDAHFNFVSIRNIENNIQPGGNSTCGEQTDLENQPPTADAGEDYTIPKSTAFKLHGSATDPDGTETLTYNWSQDDPEQAPDDGTPSPTWQVGPLYRSILPLDSPDRYMPRLSDVLNGNLTPTFEVTPSVSRVMNFSYVVRDNGSGFGLNIGQTASDLMQVTVDADAGPFAVTSQNEADIVWQSGQTKTITWDVASTDGATINEANVNIVLATDGENFDTMLAENVPNDGQEQITVPNIETDQARIMVQAADNIFYAVNQNNFSIEEPDTFQLNFDNLDVAVCQPEDAVYTFTYQTFSGFSETATFSASGLPDGASVSFSPETASEDGTAVEMTISNTGAVDLGEYTITVTGTSDSSENSQDVTLGVFNSTVNPVTLTTPENNATEVAFQPSFSWEENPNAASYAFQLATDDSFQNVVYDETVEDNSLSLPSSQALDESTTYFWRVKAGNSCGEADYSEVFTFTTQECTRCSSEGNTEYGTSTTLVQIGDIDNSSGKPSGYSDYTDISTTVSREADYNLTINVNSAGNYTVVTKVWIDWNQNCSFDDPGEEYDLGNATNVDDGPTTNSPLTITVPDDAVLGNSVMRVSTKYSQAPGPCETDFDGEVEDYTLIVDDEFSVDHSEFDGFALYPNPNNGNFSVKFNPKSAEPVTVKVFDLNGRLIYKRQYEGSAHFKQQIDLGNAQSGLYMVRIKSGQQQVSKKIVVR